jgi:hypothetical protein
MTGQIEGGWISVTAAYCITFAVLIAQAIRLWRLSKEADRKAAGGGSQS